MLWLRKTSKDATEKNNLFLCREENYSDKRRELIKEELDQNIEESDYTKKIKINKQKWKHTHGEIKKLMRRITWERKNKIMY